MLSTPPVNKSFQEVGFDGNIIQQAGAPDKLIERRSIIMKNYVISTMDDIGRFLVPKDLRDSFNWNKNVALTISLKQEDGMALVSDAADKLHILHCTLDHLGRMTLPTNALKALDWKPGTKIALSPSRHSYSLVLMKVA